MISPSSDIFSSENFLKDKPPSTQPTRLNRGVLPTTGGTPPPPTGGNPPPPTGGTPPPMTGGTPPPPTGGTSDY